MTEALAFCVMCHDPLCEGVVFVCSEECQAEFDALDWHAKRRLRQGRRIPWRETERSFKQHRDKRVPVSLPKVKFLERAE